jgi:hypothetical protein
MMRRLFPFVFGSDGRRSQLFQGPRLDVSDREKSSAHSQAAMPENSGDDPFSGVLRLQPQPPTALPSGLKDRLYGIPESTDQEGSALEGHEAAWDRNPLVPDADCAHPNRHRLHSIPVRERKRAFQIRTWSAAACIVVLAAMGWAWMWREEWSPRFPVEPGAKAKPQAAAKEEPSESNPIERSNGQANATVSDGRSENALGSAPLVETLGPMDSLIFFASKSAVLPSASTEADAKTHAEEDSPSCMGTPVDEEVSVAASGEEHAQLDWGHGGGLTPVEVEMEAFGIRGALRKRFGIWGESMLSRTDGRWGWRLTGVEEPGRIELSIASLHITHIIHENETHSRH